MNIISFAIIGPSTENTRALEKAIGTRGHRVTRYTIKSIDYNLERNDGFLAHDIYIFRAFNNSPQQASALAQALKAHDKCVIDEALTSSYCATKLHESLQLQTAKIPQPTFAYTRDAKQWRKVLEKFDGPVIVKPESAQKGRGVEKYNSPKEALTFLQQNPRGHIVQEYIPIQYDVRVIICGNTIIGAMKRFAPEGDFRTNASLGGRTENHVLTMEESAIALSAHKLFGYDLSGVDLIHKNGKPLILEVNITPQWSAFDTATGYDVGDRFIDYIIEKYEKTHRLS